MIIITVPAQIVDHDMILFQSRSVSFSNPFILMLRTFYDNPVIISLFFFNTVYQQKNIKKLNHIGPAMINNPSHYIL